MGYKAIKIDELTIDDHYHLGSDDKCYYLMEYTKGAGYRTPENSHIHNFKKLMTQKGKSDWHYKTEAIEIIAKLFRSIYIPMLNLEEWTLIPIPPSKCIEDPLYDDRMTKLLKRSCLGMACDIREVILTIESREASHTSSSRASVAEIRNNLFLDQDQVDELRMNIILFDDVLTSGAHYLACKNIILEKYPDANIYGMFIARRVLPNVTDDFDDWDTF